MQKLFKHQQNLKDKNPNKDLICWEGGTGKMVGGCVWLKGGRDEDALVICPKKIVKKWQKGLKDWGTKATVLSKEEFKKYPIKKWSGIVVDEADEFASPLFIGKKRSQLSTALYRLIREYPDVPVLLETATPVRSSPWNLHTLLCYIGEYIDWKVWRSEFFELRKERWLPFMAWIPKPDWREKIRPYIEKYADIVLLKDCVDDLPPIIEEEIKVKTPKYEMGIEDKIFFSEHRWEQQNKAKEIKEQGKQFRKVLVVAYYKEQIKELEKELSKDKETFSIHGDISTDKQEDIISKANSCDDCYFIVQASIGAGFDADTFSCCVFASMSYAVRDFMQMRFRIRRISNLHPVKYVYLIGGRCDKAVYKNVNLGKNFIPSEFKNN